MKRLEQASEVACGVPGSAIRLHSPHGRQSRALEPTPWALAALGNAGRPCDTAAACAGQVRCVTGQMRCGASVRDASRQDAPCEEAESTWLREGGHFQRTTLTDLDTRVQSKGGITGEP